jgi:hypothetical protein
LEAKMKRKRRTARQYLNVAEADALLTAWAHEHNIALAARTHDPNVDAYRRHAAAQPGFWEHVAKPGAASRKGTAKWRGQVDAKTQSLITCLRAQAVEFAGDERYWHRDGSLNVPVLVVNLAKEYASVPSIESLHNHHTALHEHVGNARASDNPTRNLTRAFRKWLTKVTVRWPSRDEARAEYLSTRHPDVARYHSEKEAATRRQRGDTTGV